VVHGALFLSRGKMPRPHGSVGNSPRGRGVPAACSVDAASLPRAAWTRHPCRV